MCLGAGQLLQFDSHSSDERLALPNQLLIVLGVPAPYLIKRWQDPAECLRGSYTVINKEVVGPS